jgi:choline dehydrogenase-like flavoprotein
LVEAYRRGLELAGRPEIRRLAKNPPPPEPSTPEEMRRRVIGNAYSLPHVVGTFPMGSSPESGGVVDALGRVHGVERLTHLVTIMLAEHLSERLPRLL